MKKEMLYAVHMDILMIQNKYMNPILWMIDNEENFFTFFKLTIDFHPNTRYNNKVSKFAPYLYGRIAQLVRALASHARGQRFKSVYAHWKNLNTKHDDPVVFCVFPFHYLKHTTISIKKQS